MCVECGEAARGRGSSGTDDPGRYKARYRLPHNSGAISQFTVA